MIEVTERIPDGDVLIRIYIDKGEGRGSTYRYVTVPSSTLIEQEHTDHKGRVMYEYTLDVLDILDETYDRYGYHLATEEI